jgi:hypothetical protein
MITTVEGVYKQGKIKLHEIPAGLQEARVLVTFLPNATVPSLPRRMIYGQFAGEHMSTEDDFRIAEWRGDAEDQNGD